jgi:putative oxidoreductase
MQKALGWFGGTGLRGTLDFLRKSGVPSPVAALAIMAELLGPLGPRPQGYSAHPCGR